MDLIELGCSILRTTFLEQVMSLFGYLGHGSVAGVVVLLLLAHGYLNDNQRTKRAGIALFAAVALAAVATEVLRHVISVPRPKGPSSQGFPSGPTSMAFASATVLTATFPALGPFFYLLAMLTAVSRVYFRARFTWDVLGSAIIGLLAGIPIARQLTTRPPLVGHRLMRFAIWTGVTAVGISGLGFFYSMEKKIDTYRVVPESTRNTPAIATFDFGAPEARRYLLHGWFSDERWLGDKQTVVWANGLASELTIDLPKLQNYRFRLYLFPYSPRGPACQTVEIKLNNAIVHKLFLEKGWHAYEFSVPQSAIRIGANSVQFFYDYAESPRSREQAVDKRSLSVAFDRLDVF